MYEAIKVALDPTPAQERCLLSHAGAARFAFNAALAHVKESIEAGEKPEWSFYSLRKWWNHNKDELAVDDDGVIWWAENSKESTVTASNPSRRACLTGLRAARARARAIAWASQSLSQRTSLPHDSRMQPAVLDSSTVTRRR